MIISYSKALEIIETVATKSQYGTESVMLSESAGRILAQSVVSDEEIPPFTNSAMDGFALCALSTVNASKENPLHIKVKGLLAAGDLSAFEAANKNHPGTATEIMTGAPLPASVYDSVVRIEDVTVDRSTEGNVEFITLTKPVQKGENVRLGGTDFSKGQVVLTANTRISAEHILACASLGITKLTVKRMPKVVIICTGSELVPPDYQSLDIEKHCSSLNKTEQKPTEKATPTPVVMIRNSTGPFLKAAFQRINIDATYLGIVKDDTALYKKYLEKAIADGADLVISTGAVSMGKYDFVSSVLNEIGAAIHFHKVAIRPGKPLLFAELKGAKANKPIFFGVPGNPISTAVGLRFFIEPFIRAKLGLPREKTIHCTASNSFKKPDGLRCFFKAISKWENGSLNATILKGQASYLVSSLLDADCWAVISEEGSEVDAGTKIELVPLHHGFESRMLV